MDKPSGSGYGVPTEEPHHAGSLAPTAPTLYCPTSQRKRNDNVCTGLFLVFMAFSVLAGIGMMAAGTRSDDTAELRTPAYYNRSLTCDVKSFQSAYTTLYPTGLPSPSGSSETDESDNNAGVDSSLAIGIAIWLPITIVVGIPASLLYLHLFKKWPMLMVKMSLFGTLGLLGIMTIITFATGAWPLGIIMLIFTAVLGLLIFWVRAQLPLCAELLGVASHALMENLRIIPTSLGITFASMGILVFLIVAIVLASNVGKAQVNGLVTNRVPVVGSNNEIGYCYDNMNRQVPCCVWTVDGFPTLYILISAITIMWTTFVIMQIKLHVVADVIAQWYYQPVGAFTNTKEAPSVRLAVRHALTTGFGTNVFAGAILFIISMIRSALRQQGRKNLLCAVINCFAQPILALLEKFTQFATIAAAITGKPFLDAAKDMFEALKRCLFKTDSVWWVPNLVIGMVVYAMSLVWAALPFMAVAAESKNWGVGFAVAIFSFILMVIILNLSAGILMDIVNTLYCLYALDRDTKVITRPEVHNIYNQVVALTCPDAVVQNPGGEIAYGRAEEGHAPPPPPVYPATNPPGYYHPERDTQPLMTQPPQPLYVGHPVVYTTNYPPSNYPGYTSSTPAPRY